MVEVTTNPQIVTLRCTLQKEGHIERMCQSRGQVPQSQPVGEKSLQTNAVSTETLTAEENEEYTLMLGTVWDL